MRELPRPQAHASRGQIGLAGSQSFLIDGLALCLGDIVVDLPQQAIEFPVPEKSEVDASLLDLEEAWLCLFIPGVLVEVDRLIEEFVEFLVARILLLRFADSGLLGLLLFCANLLQEGIGLCLDGWVR